MQPADAKSKIMTLAFSAGGSWPASFTARFVEALIAPSPVDCIVAVFNLLATERLQRELTTAEQDALYWCSLSIATNAYHDKGDAASQLLTQLTVPAPPVVEMPTPGPGMPPTTPPV